MEVLSQKIQQAVESNTWDAVKLGSGGPTISHMFFADDLLLFGRASFSQARVMDRILAKFCNISGQAVSRAKSRIWFSPNTPGFLKNPYARIFKFKQH